MINLSKHVNRNGLQPLIMDIRLFMFQAFIKLAAVPKITTLKILILDG